MKTRRLSLEHLEPRIVLSSVAEFGLGEPVDVDPFLQAATYQTLNCEEATTTLTLASGELVVLHIAPEDLVGQVDLQGVCVELYAFVQTNTLEVAGSIAQGSYNDGLLDMDATVELQSAFRYVQDPLELTLGAGGTMNLVVEQNEFKYAELTDVEVEANIDIGGSNLQLQGIALGAKLTLHQFQLKGCIPTVADFTYTNEPMTLRIAAGKEVCLDTHAGEFVELEIDEVEMDLAIDQESTTLPEIVAYKNVALTGYGLKWIVDIDGVDFEDDFVLREDFTYSQGPVTAKLTAGGNLGVKVEQSQFKWAELQNVEVEADVDIGGSPLKLKGPVYGKLNENYTIDLLGSVTVEEDFTYSRAALTLRMPAGGQATLRTHSGEFVELEVDEVELDLATDQGSMQLADSIKFYPPSRLDGLDFEGTFVLREDFEYTQGPVTATLKAGGTVNVEVEQDQLKKAEIIGVEGEVEIDVPNTNVLKLAGSLKGKYDSGLFDLGGSLSLRETFEYTRHRFTVRIMPGEEVRLGVRGEHVRVRLDGVEFEADVALGRRTLELAGTIARGRIRDGILDLRARTNLRSPFVVVSRSPVTVKLVSADIDIAIRHGRLRKLLIRHPVFRVCISPRPRRRNAGRILDFVRDL